MQLGASFKLGPFTVDAAGRIVTLRPGNGAGVPVPLA